MLENELIFTQKDGVRLIKMNRPRQMNAFNRNMYETITRVLNEDAQNDRIVVTILTGIGEYYSSGNDIKDAMSHFGDDDAKDRRLDLVRNMITAFINYPKLLIAVVNGPAIGIAATTLPLCDIVYASERARFDTPFVRLGLCAEAASSSTFPAILGRSKASEVLLLGEPLSAEDALRCGLVSRVVPHAELGRLIEGLRKFGQLPVSTLKRNKSLITRNFVGTLHESNEIEVRNLKECVETEEFSNAIMAFMSRKSKL